MRNKVTSFFFTNFPDYWDSKAPWKMFRTYGIVVDVYVAFKKTKLDTRFGFTRFINIRDLANFEKRLKGIMIGDSKIIINRAKYIKVGGKGVPFESAQVKRIFSKSIPVTIPNNEKRHSYRDVMYGGPVKPRGEPKSHGHVEPVRVKAIELVEDDRIKERLDCCWIGKARNFEVIQNAWDIIKENRLADCNTKYLGGLSYLFEWDSKDIAWESMESNILWLSQWFDELKPWDGICSSVERLILKSLKTPISGNLTLISFNEDEPVVEDTFKGEQADRDNSFSDDSRELDTEEGELVEVHSCNDDLPMGPNMDLLVNDHSNSEKALGSDHNKALNPNDGPSIKSFMPNTDFEPNGDRVNELANGDCVNELDNELDELLASFKKLSEKDGTNLDTLKGKKKLKHKKKKLLVGGNACSSSQLSRNLDEGGLDDSNELMNFRRNNGYEFPLLEKGEFYWCIWGLLTMWDSLVFSMKSHIINPNYLCAVGSWNGVSQKVALLNVYGPQSSAEKALL
ncbi:nucleotide-binding alpha-beta plait domain-containing protein [Tanacetum coccineum]